MLLLAQIIICLLLFTAISIVVFQATPVVEKGARRWHNSRLSRLNSILEKMFVFEVTRKRLLVYNIAFITLGVFLGYMTTGKFWGMFIGGFIGSTLPLYIAKKLETMRLSKFSEQIVDMLMLMSGSLRAGLNLLQSLETVVEEMPSPMAQEVGLLVREVHVGVPLEEAFRHLRQRVPLPELDLITTAVFIARETGGDLTKTFIQLVFSMREKSKLEGKVKALTVQGRLQGVIMSVIPIFFAGAIHQMNRGHFDVMLKDRLGQMLLGIAVVVQIIGIFLITKLSKVDI